MSPQPPIDPLAGPTQVTFTVQASDFRDAHQKAVAALKALAESPWHQWVYEVEMSDAVIRGDGAVTLWDATVTARWEALPCA